MHDDMLRRATTSLSRRAACATLLRRLPPRPATTLERHPPVHPGLRPAAAAAVQLRRLSDFGVSVPRRMARRSPPTRPEGYSTSDSEADGWSVSEDDEEEVEEVQLEPMSVDDVAAGKEWEGFTLEYDHEHDLDADDEDAAE